MRLRRDLLLFGLLAVAALAGGWWLLQRPGADRPGLDGGALGKAAPVSADTFRATVCGGRRCVLVEAGGMAFLFGASEGAGDALGAMGLLRATWMWCCCPSLIWMRWRACPASRALCGRRDGRSH